LVEGNKLAVEVSTANGIPGSRYPNLFVISAIPRNPHTCKELEQEIEREIERLKKEAVDASELTKVKNQLEADFIRSLASNAGLASQLSYFQVVAGDWRYLEEHLKVVERISAEDIMAVARKYLNKENRTVATLVKEEHEP
jgi:predicted Zn-dependent peptidase